MSKTVKKEVPAAITAEVKKQMADDEISICQAIRNVAKKFPESRGDVVAAFSAKPFGVNKFTVNTQFQRSRVAA